MKKRHSRTAGLLPGTMVHTGSTKKDTSTISILDYNSHEIVEKQVKHVEEAFEFRDSPKVTWINIDSVHDTAIIERLGKHFGLHPLVMEDIVHTSQRAKIDEYDDYVYIVIKMLYRESGKIVSEQVSMILGDNLLLSFQEDKEDVFNLVRDRLNQGKGKIREMGSDYLAYSLVDAIVDNYYLVLEEIGEDIEKLEAEIIHSPGAHTVVKLQKLKREVISLRKNIWPLREAINSMNRLGSRLMSPETEIYVKDVYDHTIQIIDTVESYRDILSGLLDIYLSSISNRMNEVMKVLTVIATIFIPLTFVTGIYGMNFRYMPEIYWEYGYYAILAVMFGIFLLMMVYFKRKKWI